MIQKKEFLIVILFVNLFVLHLSAQNNIQVISKINGFEYKLIQSIDLNTYLLEEVDSVGGKEKLYVLPLGSAHDFHMKNLPNFFIDGDTIFYHSVDFELSYEELGKKNWSGSLRKVLKNVLPEHDEKKEKYIYDNVKLPNDLKNRSKLWSAGKSVVSPLSRILLVSEIDKRNGLEKGDVYYSFIKRDEYFLLFINYENRIVIFKLNQNWSYVNDKPIKHQDDFNSPKEYMDYFFTAGWILKQKTPFPPGPIRTFSQNEQQYIVAVNTDEVYLIKEDGLEKVAQLPTGLAKDGTLIIDQDADEVFFAPQLKSAAYGQWREQAVNVLKDCPVEK